MGTNASWVPPYADYFGHRNGMLWAEYLETGGTSGMEPPAWAMSMVDDIAAFQQAVPGSAEAGEIGARMAKTMTESLMFIGTVSAPAPIYVSNRLSNVPEFQTWSYEYYRTYPYRGTQWSLTE